MIAVRPPPRVAEAFVSGERLTPSAQPPSVQPLAVSSAQPPSTPPPSGERLALDAQPSAVSRRRRGIVPRANGAEAARLTVYLAPGDAAKLRRYCFDRGLAISEVASEAIATHVAALDEG